MSRYSSNAVIGSGPPVDLILNRDIHRVNQVQANNSGSIGRRDSMPIIKQSPAPADTIGGSVRQRKVTYNSSPSQEIIRRDRSKSLLSQAQSPTLSMSDVYEPTTLPDVYKKTTINNASTSSNTSILYSESASTSPVESKQITPQQQLITLKSRHPLLQQSQPLPLSNKIYSQPISYRQSQYSENHAGSQQQLTDNDTVLSLDNKKRLEVGLDNLGNTCFMNSALQCLLHIEPFVQYFASESFDRDLNPSSSKKGVIASSFKELIRDIGTLKPGSSIAPTKFQQAIVVFAPYLLDYQQQDSQEFMRFLLDGMSEDLCRTRPTALQPAVVNSHEKQTNPGEINQAQVGFTSPTRPSILPVLPLRPTVATSPKEPSLISSASETPRLDRIGLIQRTKTETHAIRDRERNDEADSITSSASAKDLLDGSGSGGIETESRIRVLREVLASRRSSSTNGQMEGIESNNNNNNSNSSDLVDARVKSATNRSSSDKDTSSAPLTARATFSSQIREVMTGRSFRILRPGGNADVASTPRAQSPNSSYLQQVQKEAKEAWNRYLHGADSVVSDTFAGLLQSSVRCLTCGHRSCAFDPFLDLSLPIPRDETTSSSSASSRSLFGSLRQDSRPEVTSAAGSPNINNSVQGKPITLERCLSQFTAEEVLDGENMFRCEACKTNRKCLKQMSIYHYPKILVVHIKRFRFSSSGREKVSADVQFPFSGLDITSYLSSDRPRDCNEIPKYDLIAVCNHYGTLNSGHYIAHVDTAFGQSGDSSQARWLCFNDASVSVAHPDSLSGPSAYVLFYRLRECNDTAGV